MTKWDLSQICKVGSTCKSQLVGVVKIVTYKEPEITSSQWHTKISTICRKPPTKKTGTYQERSSTSTNIKKGPQWDQEEGLTHDIINPICPRWPTNEKIIILQSFSPRNESSESHIRLVSPDVQHQEHESRKHLTLKASGA